MAILLITAASSLFAGPLFVLPPAPKLSDAGEQLVIEYEVGGKASYLRHPYPEAPDARYSGITAGIGYDFSTVVPSVSVEDWKSLGDTNARRLASTHPYKGRIAQQHLHEVIDILVLWENAIGVFDQVDVTRTFETCRRTFPGFDDLRANAQAAIVSLVFNRGNSMVGPNRVEMRSIRDAVPRKDYQAMADAEMGMIKIWRGTDIYNGMQARRTAEAKLFLTP